MKDNALIFGQYLKQIRQNRGLTLVGLADLIGVSMPYLSLVENGKRGFSLDLLEKLAETLKVPLFALLEKLFAGEGNSKIFPDQELYDYNLANLIQNKKINLNYHPLSEEERKKLIDLLYVIFPDKKEIADTANEKD